MNDRQKTIYVYAHWKKEPSFLGTMYVDSAKGRELFSFEYEEKWLKSPEANYFLDPDLHLYRGRQFVPMEKPIFGIFADSCPDRWGRLLMKRREMLLARKEERKPKQLLESDFLLGVYDRARMGALRFALKKDGPFLSDDDDLAAPPWATLRKLEAASTAFEKDEGGLSEKWLNQLLAPGSSLGGARPKATVCAPDGALWIAKFPSKHDESNAGAWEMTAHDLAVKCGIDAPEARLETFSKSGSTFLVKRFDREGAQRVHFSSAMTLLGKTDGASSSEGVSYLDLASFIRANGAAPRKDLRELWRRIVFSIAVSNTDDHLRNHGFLLTDSGWRLSPVYDVNPCIYGNNLSLNVNAVDSSVSFDLALETAHFYEIPLQEARAEIENMKEIISADWKTTAAKYGLSHSAIQYMEPAFDMRYK